MMIRMLVDQGKELKEMKRKYHEKEDIVNKLMKQLKIKNVQNAAENGSYREWCCGRLFKNYHNLREHKEGAKHKKEHCNQ